MSENRDSFDDLDSTAPRVGRPINRAQFAVVCGFIAILSVALCATILLKPTVPPLPEIAHDPLLVQGRELYFNRCASCHGEGGLGDGPSARVLPGGRAGNLTDAEWRYGDAPSHVLGVIRKGTPDGKMPGWESVYSPSEQRAVAAYVYFLARRPVPPELRASE